MIKLLGMKETDIVQLINFIDNDFENLPAIILLNGEVGAGKTTFSRYFIETSKSAIAFSSPTYNIVNIYDDISPNIYHFDLYRISEDDYEWIYETLDEPNKLLIFEWAELHMELFEEYDWIRLHFEYEADNTRTITLDASNEKYLKSMETLIHASTLFEK